MKPIALAVKAVQSLHSLGWFTRLTCYPCCPDPPAPAFGLMALVELRHPDAPAGEPLTIAVVTSWEDVDTAMDELSAAFQDAAVWRWFPPAGAPAAPVQWRRGYSPRHLETHYKTAPKSSVPRR